MATTNAASIPRPREMPSRSWRPVARPPLLWLACYFPRPAGPESAVLESLAGIALSFTSWVSLSPPQSLLLEVGASEALFGGLDNLRQRLTDALPYAVSMAVTPAPSASLLMARIGLRGTVRTRAALRSALGEIPVAALQLPQATRKQLENTGLGHLRDLWRLPKGDFIRRFGKPLGQYLDCLTGSQPEPQPAFHLSPTFEAARELPLDMCRKGLLWPWIEALLDAMLDFLVRHDAGVRCLLLTLAHSGRPASEIPLALRRASRDPSLITKLLDEKLQGWKLPAPVVAVALETRGIEPFVAVSDDLFGDAPETGHEWQQILEELQSRLGRNAVQRLASRADYRPEKATAPLQATPGRTPHRGPGRRPLWLLSKPLRLAHRPTLLSGRERIQSGWWDGGDVQRDYFVAQAPRGGRLWVYRDREQGWYVHGVFA